MVVQLCRLWNHGDFRLQRSSPGKYIFGFLAADFSAPNGKLLLANPSATGLWSYEEIELKSFPNNLGQFLKGFGQGSDGEIYALTSTEIGPQGSTGKVYKLVFVD